MNELPTPEDPVTETSEVYTTFWVTYINLRNAGFSKSEACRIVTLIVLEIVYSWEGHDSDEDSD